ncbi:MAG: FAD-dependent oxidoreductase [Microbacteriaceae bacterium]
MNTPSIAIVGSGPSGCYTAQFLRKQFPDSPITIFDRLPVRYGLVRFGVAPDHPGTKAVSQQFDRLFERDNVIFQGDTEIGSSLTLDELRSTFDCVVLATGLSEDRTLGIPGENLDGVFGSGRITRLINGHPDSRSEGVAFGNDIVIVGAGNVAIDLLRLSLTSAADLVSHGVESQTADIVSSPHPRRIHVVSRAIAGNAKFDIAMIKELTKLDDVRFTADSLETADGGDDKRIEAINTLLELPRDDATREVQFHFGWVPAEISGSGSVEKIAFDSVDGTKTLELNADTVFTAIGFTEARDALIRKEHHTTDESEMDSGYLAPGLYCVGWFRRGPTGTIPANRADAKLVADRIIRDFSDSTETKENN